MIFIIAFIIFFLDQLSKFIITKNLLLNQSVPIIKGVFHFTLVHNRGAAFGILKNQIPLFIITSTIAILLIFLGLRASPKKPSVYNLSLALILAGALGNLIDRFSSGYVIDFLDFRIWPVFNIADSSITAGTIMLGWLILRSRDKIDSQK